MASSIIHEATAFEIQMKDMRTPPKEGLFNWTPMGPNSFVFIALSPVVSQSRVRSI